MRLLTIILFIFIIPFTTKAQENIDLFVLLGQSNARGHKGDAQYYPADPNNIDQHIRLNFTNAYITSSNGWMTMGPQETNKFPTGQFGPEVTLARELYNNGFNPAFFKYTEGGSGIYDIWYTPGEGGLYDTMVKDLKTAISELEAEGHTVTPRGLIWIQGETDADFPETAALFQERLQSIIDDMRNNVLKSPNLPVILGVDEQMYTIEENPAVLNGQENIALNDDNIRFSSMYGFSKADYTHLDPAGLEDHGNHLYELYSMLDNNDKPLEYCSIESTPNTVSTEFKTTWAQSFKPDCFGNLIQFGFDSATTVNSPFTVTISNGSDCEATVLYSKTINQIKDGRNTFFVNTPLYLDREHTYYLEVSSNLGIEWQVRYSDSNQIIGNLKTYESGTDQLTCKDNRMDHDMGVQFSLSPKNTFPIVLHSFDVTTNENDAILMWTTAAETNNSHFEIQRSIDGIYFETIETVLGNNNSTELIDYNYTDKYIGEEAKQVYYRLVQFDYDGTKEVFPIEIIKFNNRKSITGIYPNPVSANHKLTIVSNDISTVSIYNTFGERMIKKSFDKVQEAQISTENLTPGVYVIEINNRKTTEKLIIH